MDVGGRLRPRLKRLAGLVATLTTAILLAGAALAQDAAPQRPLAAHEADLEAARESFDDNPDSLEWLSVLVESLENVGDARLRAGDLDGALSAYNEVLDHQRILIFVEPTDMQRQADRLVNLLRVQLFTVDEVIRRSLLDEALGALNDLESRSLLRPEERDEFESLHREQFATAPITTLDARRVAGLIDAFQQIEVSTKRLFNDDTKQKRYVALMDTGREKLEGGKPEQALIDFEAAARIAFEMAEDDPGFVVPLYDLGVAASMMGMARFESDDFEGAAEAFAESQSIFELLISKNPNEIAFRKDLGLNFIEFGRTHSKMGDNASALAAYDEALAIIRWAIPTEPDSDAKQRRIAVSLFRLGVLRAKADDVAGALELLEEAQEINRRLESVASFSAVVKEDLRLGSRLIYEAKRILKDTKTR